MTTASSSSWTPAERMFAAAALALPLLACGAQSPDGDGELGVSVAALSVCDETVPADRNVDGVPAYAQCTASNNAAIYSNDGINTSTTQTSSDWIRTQYSGGYQCTEFAHRYLYFRWDVDWVPRGNAGTWCDSQPPAGIGVVQTMAPVHGDIMVLAPGSCGADGTTGHVNIVDVAGTAGSLTAVEQNGARRGNYKLTCAKCFLHVMANDGTPANIPANPGDPTMGMAGSGAMPTAGMTAPPPPATTPPATVPPPPSTPAVTPPAPAPAAPVPVPATPAPVTAPPAPITAPVTMPVPAAMPYVPAPRNEGATDSSGCAVTRPGSSDWHAFRSLAFLSLPLLVAARRKRAPA